MNEGIEQFKPEELYASYKRIRNKLRKIEPLSLTLLAAQALHKVYNEGVDAMRSYQPWHILLLLKWNFMEADRLSHRRPPATQNTFNKLLNILHDMDDQVRMPSEFESPDLFVRQLAFQQFPLQQPGDRSALARQEFLFCNLPENHPFQKDFLQLTGLSCRTFTELAFAHFIPAFQSPAMVFPKSFFSNLEPYHGSDALGSFWRFIMRSIPELSGEFSNSGQSFRSISDQMMLPSPLVEFPMLDLEDGRFLIYFPTLLFRSLESSIYRSLRQRNPEKFGSKFGPIFESYVEQCLKDAEVTYFSESQLKRMLPGQGKVVDFFVKEDECNILIDAKGVEASVAGRLSHEIQPIFRAVKASVGKAIEQGQETLLRLQQLDESDPCALKPGQTYLVVVTYDDLHLGPSAESTIISNSTLKSKLEMQFGAPLPIPFRNIFFVSSREFEVLLALLKPLETSLTAVFKFVQESESNRATQKFTFKQHLESLLRDEKRNECYHLPFMEHSLDQLAARCSESLPKTTG